MQINAMAGIHNIRIDRSDLQSLLSMLHHKIQILQEKNGLTDMVVLCRALFSPKIRFDIRVY